MLETTVKFPKQLNELNSSLQMLSEKPSFEQAQMVINNVTALLNINESNSWKPFNDSQGKIRSNAGWFMVAEGFADKRAAHKIADNNSQNIDLKCFWMKKLNKSVISWLVALTPNFEDEPFYGNLNIGIDFVIPEEADRVLVILSKNYVIRTVELQDALSVTQQDIFNTWLTDFDYSNKAQVHEILWKSFDFEPISKAFYVGTKDKPGIVQFFNELKQFLAEDIKIFDDKHAAYFTNRLIGRIVFCWFLNKKGIINRDMQYFQVGDMDAGQYYRQKLETLFFKVFNTPLEDRVLKEDQITPFLNGGLFEVKENDMFGREELAFPNDYFDRFYSFLKHYNFTTDESTATFQQVAIDPEMLGRIFENLLAEQVEETGEQARKAKGAFYTPREIVDYMCRESLREYLKTKISEDDLRDQRIGLLLDVKPHEFRDQQRNYRSDLKPYKYDILKALDEIKIIDPACGSGAFPMGMLHLLLIVYERLDNTFDSYKKKINIIKNNLFGVDIEPMAVEICRLRAWLSIIVDEESDSKKIEPLPNLDFKFICANSLIPLLDKVNDTGLFDKIDSNKLIEIRDKYFNARTKNSKDSLHKRYEKLIDHKNIGSLVASEREKQLKTYHPFDSENIAQFFDAEFIFGESGFDIVLGNPPYIGEKGHKEMFQPIAESKFGKRFYKRRMDLFYFFFHLALDLGNNNSQIAFITTNYYPTATGAIKLRQDLKMRSTIKKLINFNELKIFESALGQHNMITMFCKGRDDTISAATCITEKKGIANANILQSIIDGKDGETVYSEVPQKELFDGEDCQIRLFGLSSVSGNHIQGILEKMKNDAHLLGSICNLDQGIVSGADKVSDVIIKEYPELNLEKNKGIFILNEDEIKGLDLSISETKKFVKLFYKNSDIYKWVVYPKRKLYVLYVKDEGKSINLSNKLRKHFERYKKILVDKKKNCFKNKWLRNIVEPWLKRDNYFVLFYPRDKKVFESTKIVNSRRAKINIFALEAKKMYEQSDIVITTLKDEFVKLYDIKFILALLNSRLYYQWLYHRGKRKGEMLELFQKPLSEVPIKEISGAQQKEFVDLVDKIWLIVNQIGYLTSATKQAKVEEYECLIDKMVYKLYNLTKEEIKIVEQQSLKVSE